MSRGCYRNCSLILGFMNAISLSDTKKQVVILPPVLLYKIFCKYHRIQTCYDCSNGELPDVYKNDQVRLYGLPIDVGGYRNSYNGFTNAYVIFGCYVIKQ